MIATWYLVLCTTVGCGSVPMQSAEACQAAIANLKYPVTGTCINTETGAVGKWER